MQKRQPVVTQIAVELSQMEEDTSSFPLFSIRREAVVLVEGVDALHLVGGEFEVEDVVVLGDVGGIGGAGDGDGAALQVPAEDDLIGRLLVSLGDGGDDLVLREGLDAGAATAEGEPGFEDGAKTGDVGLDATALVVGVVSFCSTAGRMVAIFIMRSTSSS